jgi:Sulfotransferase domain
MVNKIKIKLKRIIKRKYNFIRSYNKSKIFCIGLNKTGTTSLKVEMKELGYVVGNQRKAELLFDDWIKRDFKKLIRYCKSAQFFQDAPFSFPFTFIAMDQAFPGSKFILTVRDDAEQWYNSLIRFHGKIWGNGNIPPTVEDLKNAEYIYKGFPYYSRKLKYDVDDSNLYNKEMLIKNYNSYNDYVKKYFRYRTNDLLVINIKEKDSYSKFCKFLKIKETKDSFPWENKTDDDEQEKI